jgi:hypothetical protein
MTTVKEEWGMCCPSCGEDHSLDITAQVCVRLCPDGTDTAIPDNANHEWDDTSPVSCANCGWSGKVADTREVTVAELFDALDAAREGFVDGPRIDWLRKRAIQHRQFEVPQ